MRLYILRNCYGQVLNATFLGHSVASAFLTTGQTLKHRDVTATKQLAAAVLQSGTRKLLFDAAWRQACQDGAVEPSRRLDVDDGEQSIEHAKRDAEQIDHYISELVNNPSSKFYIHG
jgi:hypothetical protein